MHRFIEWFCMGLFGGAGLCLAMALIRVIAGFLGHAEVPRIGP